MFDRARQHVLRLFRVPHDPDPPAGAPGSLIVFRAGRNFYKLRLLRWGLGQLGALVGIVFSLQMLEVAERTAAEARANAASRPTLTQSSPPTSPTTPKTRKRASDKERAMAVVAKFADRAPPWLFTLLRVAKGVGIALYLLQIPFTYAMARLDYELRWYMVTDRSLRIRAGLASVTESTMSFANIQQVVVTQGPLQRLLGLADVRVQSAGGGGDQHHGQHMDSSLHTGVFHGVENASQIRDVILDRLRRFREAGLGDPDDHAAPAAHPPVFLGDSAAASTAARELLEEVRALRQTLA